MTTRLVGYFVPCTHVAMLLGHANKHGISSRQLLANLSFKEKDLHDPEARIPAHQYAELLMLVDGNTQDGSFWFEFGREFGFSSLGLVGQALLSCNNLNQALPLLSKFYRILSCGTDLEYLQVDDYGVLTLIRDAEIGEREKQIKTELLYSSFSRVGELLFPNTPLDIKFSFDYPEPENKATYDKYLGNDLSFNQLTPAIYVSKEHLVQDFSEANPALLEVLDHQCQKKLEELEHSNSMARTVRNLIQSLPGVYPSVEVIATQLNISSRTLNRRLVKEDTSFQFITEQIKCKDALYYVENTEMTIEEIAHHTGYSDPSNFRRAFAKWTGKSPSDYRR